jgi:hypothetical protein
MLRYARLDGDAHMNERDKAERNQALKAFLIPSGLFVACLFNAAGIYIVYTGNAIGMVFLAIGFGTILAGLFAFITFENKARSSRRRPVSNEPEPYMPPSVRPLVSATSLRNTDSQADKD